LQIGHSRTLGEIFSQESPASGISAMGKPLTKDNVQVRIIFGIHGISPERLDREHFLLKIARMKRISRSEGYPGVGISEVRSTHQATYAWLYRHDRT
jgi:hypothetical protein